jgi:hypothetical protein
VTKRNETIEEKEERLRRAAEAMAEYQARENGLSEQIARQKALRLAQPIIVGPQYGIDIDAAIGQQDASVSLADLDVQVITAPTMRLEGHAQSGAA